MFLSVFSSGSGIQQVTFEGSGDSFEKGLSPEAVADGQQAHERGLGIAVISLHVNVLQSDEELLEGTARPLAPPQICGSKM